LLAVFLCVKSIKPVGKLHLVCKRFNEFLIADMKVWKELCYVWWEDKQLKSKGFDLDWVLQESKIDDLKWLCKCLGNNSEIGQSWSYLDHNMRRTLSIGEIKEKRLCGWGIRITKSYDTRIDIGTFNEGFLWGKARKIWEDGSRFEGYFDSDRREKGTMSYKSGIKYDGEWKYGLRHGSGKMTWPNEFQYEGNWLLGQPTDDVESVHPSVRDYMEKKKCVGSITGKFHLVSHFLFACDNCLKSYCSTCWDTCHNEIHCNAWRKIWVQEGYYCSCLDEECCKNIYSPPLKKVKLSTRQLVTS